MDTENVPNRRQAERKAHCTQMDLCLGDDTIKAVSVDVSDTGVRLDMEEPLKIWLRMEVNGDAVVREAKIVWAKGKPGGGVSYGFEYTSAA